MSWYRDAACQSEDPESSFSDRHHGSGTVPAHESQECLRPLSGAERVSALAIVTGMEHGVWGGD